MCRANLTFLLEVKQICVESHKFGQNATEVDDFLKWTNNTQENNTL